MSNYNFNNINGSGKMYCNIPRFPLMCGMFSLTMTLLVNKQLADQVQNAVMIHVEEGDFYGSGISNAHGRQGVYIEQRWHIS